LLVICLVAMEDILELHLPLQLRPQMLLLLPLIFLLMMEGFLG
jgi:hypothetical protein